MDNFNYAFQDSYRLKPEEFINEYIKLLIHPKAKVRNGMKTIFKIVKLTENNKKYWIKLIIALPLNSQKLLLKSLNDYSIDIENKLSVVALLIKTHNEDVYNFLLQEFVWVCQKFNVKNLPESKIIITCFQKK